MKIYEEMLASQLRERRRIVAEMTQVHGLFPVLMKPRNGQSWSAEDKTLIMFHVHELAGLSPYLIPLILPGGVFMLPALAWWLDRRRGGRADEGSKTL